MNLRSGIIRLARPLVFALVLTPIAGCDITYNLATADSRAQAKEEWTRTYTIAEGGRLEIANTNGEITVVPSDGPAVEVSAERVAKGRDEAAAKVALGKVTIAEEQAATGVRIQTKVERDGMHSVNGYVNYRVKVPRQLAVRLSNTNGAIEVTGLRAGAEIETTNGAITGRDLGGSIRAQTVNGGIALSVTELAGSGINAQTVNGAVKIDLTSDARATLKARTANGGIDVQGFSLEGAEKSRGRLDGRINGGGTTIDVTTTNGSVTISRSTT
jgi:DUF4097 and DUF4098 domain-containing protein YvlB